MLDKEALDLLLRKWEMYWNHYKLQEESLEKRRNFLWIIQSFALGGYFYILSKIGLNIDWVIKIYFKDILIILSIIGIFFSFILKLALKRHSRSQNITEMALRDIETQFNNLSKKIALDRFILDREILFNNKSYTWPHSYETLKKEIIPTKLKSQAFWMNKFLPVIFLIFWIILFVIALVNKYPNL